MCKLSYYTYKKFPNLEKNLGGFLFSVYRLFSKKVKRAKAELIRNKRRGYAKESGKKFASRRMAAVQSKANKISYENWV